ncbi:MAG TPA: type II secretion system F family protein [Clostridia bacterium]
MRGFIILLSFISAAFLYYQLIRLLCSGNEYMSRLRRYTSLEEIHEVKKRKRRDSSSLLRDVLSKGIGKIKFLDGYKKRIQADLARAHLLLRAEEFLIFEIILFFLFFLLTILIKGTRSWLLAIVLGIVGWILPSYLLKNRIRKRMKLLNEQLGDAITMMSNSLKAGYSFLQAVDIVAEEMTGPVAEEFAIFRKEVSLGLNTEKALENLTARVRSEDLDLAVTAVMIQRQVGGNLAEVLDKITETIRDRVRIKCELKAITAQGRVSGLVISLLPVILCLIIYMINPAQMSLLFTRPLGIIMVVVAAAMELTGIMLIRRIVRIEI